MARFRLMPPQACENLFILDHIARRSAVEVVDAEGGKGWALSFDPHFWEKFTRIDPMSLITAARSPLALIRGAKSQLFHPEDAAYLLSLIAPGSPYVEIPEAEHHVMIDQPIAFVAALRALLAAWPGKRRAIAVGATPARGGRSGPISSPKQGDFKGLRRRFRSSQVRPPAAEGVAGSVRFGCDRSLGNTLDI